MTPAKKPHLSRSAQRLLRWLEQRRRGLKRLVILTHDHPDPDALASAWALAYLAKMICRARCRIAYGGVIGRGENRMMFESLGIPAQPLRKADLEAPCLALIDTQPVYRNNHVPPSHRPDIIIDHHPRNARTRGGLVLIEPVGATTTILTETLLGARVPIPIRLATAMAYGIGSETQNLGREAGPRDAAAYTALLPAANLRALWRIANPPRPASFFQTLARAIRDSFVCRANIGVHLRELPNPDRVAQMADFLLTHEGMRWSIVTGRYDGRLHVSVRTQSLSEDAGRLLRTVLGGRDRGGGHRMIAGGSIQVGKRTPEHRWRRAEEHIVEAFLKARGVAKPSRTYPFRDGA